MTQIIYTCSGETPYNKEGLLQGRLCMRLQDLLPYMLSMCKLLYLPVLYVGQAIDSPLSEIGLQQAEAAGHYLKDVQFSNVFVSDMLRAQQVQSFTFTLAS